MIGPSNMTSQDWRAVYVDECLERGGDVVAEIRARVGVKVTNQAYTFAYAYADADAYAYADADAYAYADAYADADAYAYADADADADADPKIFPKHQPEELHMKSGLYALSYASGSVTVLRLAWLKQSAGDEYDVVWSTIYRDNYSTLPSDVWNEGPKSAMGWKFGPALECEINRFHFMPLARLNPEQWVNVLPKPKGWES